MSIKLAKKTETVYVARCQWQTGGVTPFGLLWERKGYAEAADIVDRHAAMQYGSEGRFYHTWLEQITRYDDGSEEASVVREYNRPQAADTIDMSTVTMSQLKEARDWILDCVWADLNESDVAELTGEQIVKGIQRHYEGGWSAFVATVEDTETADPMLAVLAHHVGHQARISSPLNSVVSKVEALTTDKAQWRYGGFVVHCLTCDTALSAQW